MAATAPGRDLDVQIAWLAATSPDAPEPARAGVDWLVRRLERRRAKLHKEEDEVLAGPPVDFARARERLGATDVSSIPAPTLARAAAAAIRSRANALEEELAGVVSLADRERSHRARIQAKRLRYVWSPSPRQRAAPRFSSGSPGSRTTSASCATPRCWRKRWPGHSGRHRPTRWTA
jgi:CHAD domain-containing protein